jgi:hypothetical protein
MVAVSSSKWEQVQQTHIKTNNQSCNYDLGLVDYLDSLNPYLKTVFNAQIIVMSL